MKTKTIAVLGAGAWGSAIAVFLAKQGLQIKLWCHEADVAHEITHKRLNSKFLPDVIISPNIQAFTDISLVLDNVSCVFEAIPVSFLRAVLEKSSKYTNSEIPWVVLSKGIEQESLILPSDIITSVLGAQVPVVVIGGPSFARELVQGAITAIVIASSHHEHALSVAQLCASATLKPYLSQDPKGVQVGGALKNIMALIMGVAQGAGCPENTRAYLLTQGLREMGELVIFFGGKKETLYGLSGVGDMLLTCSGLLSKNFTIGELVGHGHALCELSDRYAAMPEGVNTLFVVKELIEKNKLNLPVFMGAYEIIFNKKTLDDLMKKLLEQPLSYEMGPSVS